MSVDPNTKSRTLELFTGLRDQEISTRDQFTEDTKQSLRNLENALEEARDEDLHQLSAEISKKVAEIQTRRVESDNTYSNLLFFPFNKIRGRIKKELKRRRNHPTSTLSTPKVRKKLAEDLERGEKFEFPNSYRDFIELAGQNGYIIGCPDRLFEDDSVLFYSNELALEEVLNADSVTLVTGHCLIGFDPNRPKRKQLEEIIAGGIALHDLLIYENIRRIAPQLDEKVRISDTLVNLDSHYYVEKLKQDPGLCEMDLEGTVRDLAGSHVASIQKVMPSAKILDTSNPDVYSDLENTLEWNLLEFILDQVGTYMGHDLRQEPAYAKSLAITAASYVKPVIDTERPVIILESALSAETPTQIAARFLSHIGFPNHLLFVGLCPLMDTKCSNGSMYYGDPSKRKIFVRDDEATVQRKIESSRTSPHAPEYCFYTNFQVASGARMETPCNYTFCKQHLRELASSISTTLSTYQ